MSFPLLRKINMWQPLHCLSLKPEHTNSSHTNPRAFPKKPKKIIEQISYSYLELSGEKALLGRHYNNAMSQPIVWFPS